MPEILEAGYFFPFIILLFILTMNILYPPKHLHVIGLWSDLTKKEHRECVEREERLLHAAASLSKTALQRDRLGQWANDMEDLADAIPDTHGVLIHRVSVGGSPPPHPKADFTKTPELGFILYSDPRIAVWGRDYSRNNTNPMASPKTSSVCALQDWRPSFGYSPGGEIDFSNAQVHRGTDPAKTPLNRASDSDDSDAGSAWDSDSDIDDDLDLDVNDAVSTQLPPPPSSTTTSAPSTSAPSATSPKKRATPSGSSKKPNCQTKQLFFGAKNRPASSDLTPSPAPSSSDPTPSSALPSTPLPAPSSLQSTSTSSTSSGTTDTPQYRTDHTRYHWPKHVFPQISFSGSIRAISDVGLRLKGLLFDARKTILDLGTAFLEFLTQDRGFKIGLAIEFPSHAISLNSFDNNFRIHWRAPEEAKAHYKSRSVPGWCIYTAQWLAKRLRKVNKNMALVEALSKSGKHPFRGLGKYGTNEVMAIAGFFPWILLYTVLSNPVLFCILCEAFMQFIVPKALQTQAFTQSAIRSIPKPPQSRTGEPPDFALSVTEDQRLQYVYVVSYYVQTNKPNRNTRYAEALKVHGRKRSHLTELEAVLIDRYNVRP
ncbi:hypothetical protein R3P38DRAFT_2786429 [Favolaschia claudopus]|uniref:Uncharacterized protein n=1 Tax=Favolaschia claudopus TaxID=2862362 RepID=A0AAW0ASL5_9AGAR